LARMQTLPLLAKNFGRLIFGHFFISFRANFGHFVET